MQETQKTQFDLREDPQRKWQPLPVFFPENSRDGGACGLWSRGIKSWTGQSNWSTHARIL